MPTAEQRRRAERAAKVAEMRAAEERRKARQQRLLVALGAVATVIVVVIVAVVVKLNAGSSSTSSKGPAGSGTSATAYVSSLAAVPSSTLQAVAGGGANPPTPISGTSVRKVDGKPLLLYVGAEYCPYCAAERWAVVQALSRFGQFSGVDTTHSASDDVFPNSPTFTFHGATYTSKYLTFQAVETQTNQRQGSSYAPLDKLTGDQQKIFEKFDAPPYVASSSAGAIPFLDIADKYMVSGASYSPGVLQGKTWQQVTAALADPKSDIAKGILGTANQLTAAICQVTGGQPSNVCSAPEITALAGQLGGK